MAKRESCHVLMFFSILYDNAQQPQALKHCQQVHQDAVFNKYCRRICKNITAEFQKI